MPEKKITDAVPAAVPAAVPVVPELSEVKDTASPFMDPLQPSIKAKVELTAEDKENFFKAFLADRPYVEDILLFGGKVRLKLATMTLQQNTDVFRQIAHDQDKGIAKTEDTYFIKVTLYRFSQSLMELDGKVFCPEISAASHSEKEGVTYVKVRAETLEKWPLYKLGVILEAFKEFEQKVLALSQAALSKDFWKANP